MVKKWGSRSWWDQRMHLLTQSDAARTCIARRMSSLHRLTATTARQMLRESCTWPGRHSARLRLPPPSQRVGNLLPAFKQVQVTQPQARLLLVGG